MLCAHGNTRSWQPTATTGARKARQAAHPPGLVKTNNTPLSQMQTLEGKLLFLAEGGNMENSVADL